MAPGILVVGSINMDIIVRCPRIPKRGETTWGTDWQTAAGGKGANQAVACSRLGAQTTMVGRVGPDEFGVQLRDGLECNGVKVDHVLVDAGARTGVAIILLEEDGQNRIVLAGDANRRLSEREDVAVARQLLERADAVLMPLEVPLEVACAVAVEARARGVRSVLDAGAATRAAADAGLPGLVDLISPNEAEAEALTGIGVDDLTGARKAAASLREMGARDVVLKLGEKGAYWIGDDGEGHFPAFPVEPVDTTAAGDAFTGCLTVGLAEGLATPEAIRRANAAGAMACLTLGAQPSMPTSESVDTFLAARQD
jgi:ribokinase